MNELEFYSKYSQTQKLYQMYKNILHQQF